MTRLNKLHHWFRAISGMNHVRLLILLLCCLIAACASLTIERERHVKLTCNSCHEGEPKKGRPALREQESPSEVCRRCHKYNSDGDHHPSNPELEVVGDKCAEVAPSFPLFLGKMECLTCHQIHTEDYYASGKKNFLRGGPYKERQDICFECHKKELYVSYNPHKEMLTTEGELNYATCLFCHLYPPDPKTDEAKTVKFRAAIAFLCWRCHKPMIADFLNKHFLKKPSARTADSMLKGGVKNEVILPLDSMGRVTCSTCHNPHQPGVMIKKWAKKGEGAPKKLRDSDICNVCHGALLGS